MGDAYELARPLPGAAPAQLCHAVFRDHTVYYVLERSNRRAGMELRHDARGCFVRGGGVQHDKGLAVLGEERPAREVRLAPGGGPVLAAKGLGRALAEEVDLEGGIDRHEALLAGYIGCVVGVIDGPELYARVLLHELVEPLAP